MFVGHCPNMGSGSAWSDIMNNFSTNYYTVKSQFGFSLLPTTRKVLPIKKRNRGNPKKQSTQPLDRTGVCVIVTAIAQGLSFLPTFGHLFHVRVNDLAGLRQLNKRRSVPCNSSWASRC